MLEEVTRSPHTDEYAATLRHGRKQQRSVRLSAGQTFFLRKRESIECVAITHDGGRPLVMLRFTQPDPGAPPLWFMLPP